MRWGYRWGNYWGRAPSPPAGVRAANIGDGAGIMVEWEAPTEGRGVDVFYATGAFASGGTKANRSPVEDTNYFRIKDLELGSAYCIRVAAVDEQGAVGPLSAYAVEGELNKSGGTISITANPGDVVRRHVKFSARKAGRDIPFGVQACSVLTGVDSLYIESAWPEIERFAAGEWEWISPDETVHARNITPITGGITTGGFGASSITVVQKPWYLVRFSPTNTKLVRSV